MEWEDDHELWVAQYLGRLCHVLRCCYKNCCPDSTVRVNGLNQNRTPDFQIWTPRLAFKRPVFQLSENTEPFVKKWSTFVSGYWMSSFLGSWVQQGSQIWRHSFKLYSVLQQGSVHRVLPDREYPPHMYIKYHFAWNNKSAIIQLYMYRSSHSFQMRSLLFLHVTALLPRLRMHGDIPALLHTSSCRGVCWSTWTSLSLPLSLMFICCRYKSRIAKLITQQISHSAVMNYLLLYFVKYSLHQKSLK